MYFVSCLKYENDCVDTNSWGYFRGVEVDVPGLASDQSMLKKSYWNNPGVLTADDEYVGADLGYKSTEHINVLSPFDETESETNKQSSFWNKLFNKDRELVEREFGFIKNSFKIFDEPWRRKRYLFSLALRVTLKLVNGYWRMNDGPLGIHRQINY